MAYFYVKSGGSATGDAGRYASQQTGSFATIGASGYYASLNDAFAATTVPAYGDFICISDASSLSTTTAFNGTPPGGNGAGVHIVTVDDSNCENGAVATSVQEYITGGANDWRINSFPQGVIDAYGVYAKSDDNITLGESAGCVVHCTKCTFEITGSNDLITVSGDGTATTLIDCDMIFNDKAGCFVTWSGAQVRMFGGSISTTDVSGAHHQVYNFDYGGAANGGSFCWFEGVDMQDADALIDGTSGGAEDSSLFVFKRCHVKSGVDFVDPPTDLKRGQRIEVYNCAHDSSAEYQYYVMEELNEAEHETTIYRDGSIAFPETSTKISIKIVTGANVSRTNPFWIDLPTTYADLTSASSDTLRFHILSASTLTDADVFGMLHYADGTNKHVQNIVTSTGTTTTAFAFEPFRTGTTLTTNTETWTGRTSENRYQIDLDTSGDAGAATIPIVRLFVAAASTTLYVCVTPELV